MSWTPHKKTIAGCFLLSRGWLVTFGDELFHPSLKNTSLQKHPSLAFEAFKADVERLGAQVL